MLESGRRAWKELAPAMGGYGNGGRLVWGWFRDSTLAGCRRLVENTSKTDRISVVRSLRELRAIAPKVTVDLLVDVWTEGSQHRYSEHLAVGARRALAEVVAGSQDAEVERLTRAAVQRDEDRLVDVHRDVVDLAGSIVAHRSSGKFDAPSVTHEQVSALLDDVLEVIQRWTGVLSAVHLALDAPAISGIRPMATALDKFDWEQFVEACSYREREIGDMGAGPYEQLARTARIQWVWPGQ